MTRRQAVVMVGFGASSAAFAGKLSSEGKMEHFKELFEMSQKENKGLTFWIGGQTVGGGVIKFNADVVEVKSQQYRRVIIKIASIDAVAAM
ncbi:MAG TPA: hypothetical protein VGL53_31095 [Bryobacteraceae bacterium]|jgi:hypothetical protein